MSPEESRAVCFVGHVLEGELRKGRWQAYEGKNGGWYVWHTVCGFGLVRVGMTRAEARKVAAEMNRGCK